MSVDKTDSDLVLHGPPRSVDKTDFGLVLHGPPRSVERSILVQCSLITPTFIGLRKHLVIGRLNE